MGVVTIVRCVAKFYQGYLAEKVVQIGVNRLREDAYVHIMNMPVGFFINERPSDTVSRLVNDTGTMGKAVKIMLGKALREPLNAVCMLTFAMLLNWQLTLVFLCGAPPTLWLVVLLGKKMKRATRKSLEATAQMLAKLQETIAGLKVVKVYNQQEYEHSAFGAINKKLLKQLFKISKVDAATMPVLEVLGMAAGSAALVVGAHWVTQNRMDASEFLGLLFFLGVTAEAVRKTSDIWNKIQEANAAADRVFAIVDEPVEVEKSGAFELPVLKERIEFRNVEFAYLGTDRPVLKGINLTVEAGHNVALVGPNGSGKTTLVSLLPRFYDPRKGQVLIDGRDIRDAALFSLRNQIGMVTQNVVTFNDTISANIAYGRPSAPREEIIVAAKRAYAHEFISALPDGYDTVIGEQGTGLSGGQLQRIVIARAILKNPPILIFDEATSQVDADSESKIRQAIEGIMHNRTTFIIAHRFSTVITADVIIVMDDGKIIAQGKHYQLMQSCSLYRNLYDTQLIKA
jgi:ABC-type multidrug transport system fused ATPase/permease subunit